MKLLTRLWNDEAGYVISAELVLVGTILVIGMVAGMTTLRDAVVQELSDVGHAIGSVNQSFLYHGTTDHSRGFTAGSKFWDKKDVCDTGGRHHGRGNGSCISVSRRPSPEHGRKGHGGGKGGGKGGKD